MPATRIFLLSPANSGGERARLLMREGATFPLARQLRSREGAPLGEVFRFTSGLYFRGKLVYAETFARPPEGAPGALIITPGRGLVAPGERVHRADLEVFASVPVDARDARYRAPLESHARRMLARIEDDTEIVLLGSIATGKYTQVLLEVFGVRLRFPAAFVGRGDMSRGGLMLRCVADRAELDYVPVMGASLHGPRPPRLPRRTRAT